MPKRSLDVANMGGPNAKPAPARKTERSHEENQERAYIAASRRADRSIEARVQSAKMASEIHKKRTGKAFRITEEIVMKEEMYEEEDDDFPRSYRLLKSNMQTPNAEFNARVDAYLTNRVAMSQLLSATEADWRNNEINQTFAQFFPQAQRQAQSMSHRWSTPGYSVPQPQNNHVSSPMEQHFDPNFQTVNYAPHQPTRHNERNHSMSGLSPTESRNDGPVSPPALTPGSGTHPETPQSRCASTFGNVQPPPVMDFSHDGSAFTTELPAEAKMLLGGVGMNDFNPTLYGEHQNWGAQQSFHYGEDTKYFKEEDSELDTGYGKYPDPDTMNWDDANFATPTKYSTDEQEPSWDSYINDTAWVTEQQQ
ncbi:hypothetical protein HYE67_007239 [Fusarium culmorum]|uniref:Uncharacterized protein n=1 Tax=Fusarium culmorum TaxID=5516 RepID=A0A2T4H0F4_FUSCU|nr:hypothetical protein FCULG_00008309 [Fusarium culmorum]QPC65008.1 hypothetical protein HYE67_007239 [Fusarium culmorum]